MASVRSGIATDVGRVRDHNEDAAVAAYPLFLVADGMGGHAAGEVASSMAVRIMREMSGQGMLSAGSVEEQVRRANERILRDARLHRARRGMGTTLTGLVAVDDDPAAWCVLNVGDSRVYRWFDDGSGSREALHQLTVDHSEVQELIEAGIILPEEARGHPLGNIVTRSLGQVAGVSADTWVRPVNPGERFLVCSDGLTNELTDEEIDHLLDGATDPQHLADRLVRAAVEAGGRDNVTVVVVMVD